MSLREEERQVIVTLELEKADKTWAQMEVQIETNQWELVANRLYYALFHAVSALLIHDKHEVGTHRGAVGKFSLFYVKTGLFSKEDGRLYSHLQKLREDGEYNCFIDIEREEVEQKIEPSKLLIAKIKDYIQTHP
ncbi:MAG: HEPN domain-containing protein [Bacteroidales bacterium]|nr:HEPN domain-containing protein [Bacteroidales bacterium]